VKMKRKVEGDFWGEGDGGEREANAVAAARV
jgi:hypothetical protein